MYKLTIHATARMCCLCHSGWLHFLD